MVASGLDGAGLTPTAIAGGVFPQWKTNAVYGGEGALAVAELDESDGSLVHFSPDVTIFLNLEMDHAEHFPGGLDDLKQTLRQYVEQLIAAHQNGSPKTIVAYTGCKELADVLQPVVDSGTIKFMGVSRKGETTYLNLPNDARSVVLSDCVEHRPSCYTGQVSVSGIVNSLTLTMRAPGKHQCLNGAIALSACYAADSRLNLEKTAAGISSFVGMGRRYEIIGEWNQAVLVDDYAHHPTEVAAMVSVGKQQVAGVGQFTAIFQPHRYTRLKQFWTEFMESLQHADHVIVTDVYEASESPIEGISGPDFARELSARYPELSVRYKAHSQWDELKTEIQQSVSANDLVMSIGAGDITYLLRDWPERSTKQSQPSTETVVS
jgi:UDP-N-acetylmuramate--alanine ligase